LAEKKHRAPVIRLDEDRIDEAVLALLYLNEHRNGAAWKTFDWDATDRLCAKGLISNPASKNKSVALTEDGERRGREAFERMFVIKDR
jgi:hypothetical protein